MDPSFEPDIHEVEALVIHSATDKLAPKISSHSSHEIRRNGAGIVTRCGKRPCDDDQEVQEKRRGSDEDVNHTGSRVGREESQTLSLSDVKIKGLLLEGIFHPKFENESSDKDVRREMISRVEDGQGYLEVTLKHSGSLLLWSGGSRFYSKNSANNMFTLVGEFLLRRHMEKMWGSCDKDALSNGSNERSSSRSTTKYDECGDFLNRNRLTLAFEIVTSVLGDHGEIPKQPYLILLSVADRNSQKFYTSHQLIMLAQEFCLPHNDFWMFVTQQSCNELFQFYDDIREIGTADVVIEGLDQLINRRVSRGPLPHRIVSMYPHCEYQGNILEGLVVRFVQYADPRSDTTPCNQYHFVESMNELASISEKNLSVMAKSACTSCCSQLNDFFSADYSQSDTEEMLRSYLRDRSSHCDCQRLTRVTRFGMSKEWNTTSWILSSLESQTLNDETKKILQVIQTLSELNVKTEYKLYQESNLSTHFQQDQSRLVSILHILHDDTFKKYNRSLTTDAMQLFRGFSFELYFGASDVDDDTAGRCSMDTIAPSFEESPTHPLMLKMKLLPYMIRTFGCRNGLKVLARSGVDAFEQYTLNLLNKWGMSVNAIKKWQPYLYNWGLYAYPILQQHHNDHRQPSQQAPPKDRCVNVHSSSLCDGNYLGHLSTFNSLYQSNSVLSVPEEKACFSGLLIVLSLTRDDATACGDFLSEKLRIRRRLNTTGSITELEMLSNRNGIICNTTTDDRLTQNLKKLLKTNQFSDATYIILFGCGQVDIDSLYMHGGSEHKRISGMTESWKRLKCKKMFHLSNLLSSKKSTSEQDGLCFSAVFERDENIKSIVAELAELPTSQQNNPGVLVFFPGIPGCGKSSLCYDYSVLHNAGAINDSTSLIDGRSQNDDDQTTRQVTTELAAIICEGDKVKGNYWTHVLKDRLQNTASIYLADKNATPIVWGRVGSICAESLALPVPVLPDSMALSTVTVDHPQGKRNYPFSLAFLAVCMLRVLMRPDGTHNGKLDRSTPNAMMVVVKFYCLYRDITAASILSMIHSRNYGNVVSTIDKPVVMIPFFNKIAWRELPKELHNCLVEALNLQYAIEYAKDAVTENDTHIMEERLRKLILTYHDTLTSMCATEDQSRSAFRQQVSQLTPSLAIKMRTDEHASPRFIEIASVDIDVNIIHNIITTVAKTHVEVGMFFRQVKGLDRQQDVSSCVSAIEQTNNGTLLEKTHVTMAHFSQLSQNEILKNYQQYVGHSLTITITGILIGKTVAALSVDFSLCDHSIHCLNEYPHVTVWVADNESAAKSNELPSMVQQGDALGIQFRESFEVPGTFGFWFINN